MRTQPKTSSPPPLYSEATKPNPASKPTTARSTLWRLVFFLAIFASLQGLYATAKGTRIERLFIDQATVQTAAWFIDLVDPSAQVEPVGSRLRSPGGGINVLNGCEGTDVLFLLIAAMVVAPLTWQSRVLGMGVGVVMVFVLNQARVVALFYAFRSDRDLFELLHGIVTPLVLVMATAGFFVIWLNRAVTQPTSLPSASRG